MARRTLKSKRILVTGASSGIGRQLCLQLARHETRLILLARGEEKLRTLAAEIDALGGTAAQVVVGDVTQEETRRLAVATAEQEFGGLDILINNAGLGAFARFEESDADQLRQIMEVNFFSAVELTRLALPLLLSGAQPMIVNMGTILGHRAIPRMSEYCASKFALRAWSESIRVELGRHGVDVLLVSPGSTETPFYDNAIAGRESAPWSRSTAVSAEHVATATLRAMRRGRREIVPSTPGKLLVWASKRFPGILDRTLRRYA